MTGSVRALHCPKVRKIRNQTKNTLKISGKFQKNADMCAKNIDKKAVFTSFFVPLRNFEFRACLITTVKCWVSYFGGDFSLMLKECTQCTRLKQSGKGTRKMRDNK